jgi:uncharacterized protein YigA (DUF484 family)
MNDDAVARHLRENPDFFQRHPTLLTELVLPDPHQGKAVSLVERQAALLRERVRVLEARLAELIRIGRGNDALSRNVVEWSRALLAEPQRQRMAALVVQELQRVFDIPLAALRTWSEPPASADAGAARIVAAMEDPICGSDIDLTAMGELTREWTKVRSVALIPLRRAPGAVPFGLIALGSSDPARFEAGLGTAVLESIGALAGAALAPAGSGSTAH